MDMLKNWSGNAYFGFAMVLMIGILFLLAMTAMMGGNKEGYGYHHALHRSQGGPQTASYHAVNDHTGASGDGTAFDSWNYDDDDMRRTNPLLWVTPHNKEGFLNSRFPGPAFYESNARMVQNVSHPSLMAAVRAGDLSQPAAVTEITQGPYVEGISGVEACNHLPGSDPSKHVQGGRCDGSHSYAGDSHSEDNLAYSLF